MLANWQPYILNALDIRLSNGFTEGCSNAIKTLKYLAFDFRNFSNFRARILLAARHTPTFDKASKYFIATVRLSLF